MMTDEEFDQLMTDKAEAASRYYYHMNELISLLQGNHKALDHVSGIFKAVSDYSTAAAESVSDVRAELNALRNAANNL